MMTATMTTRELISLDGDIAARMKSAARGNDLAAMKSLISERKAVRQALEARRNASNN